MKKIFYSLFIIFGLILPASTMASDFFTGVLQRTVSVIVWPLFVAAVVVMCIWVGVLYLTTKGDPEKIKKANLALIFIIIGIIVAILGYRMVATLSNLINPPANGGNPPPGGGGGGGGQCIQNDINCQNNTECCSGNCQGIGGNISVCQPAAPPPTGRCCNLGTCNEVAQNQCVGSGKIWYGAGTTCVNFLCPNVAGS